MRSAWVWLAAFALAVFAVGIALEPLESPTFTRALAGRYALAAEAGLPADTMLALAEQVRAFVVEGSGELPTSVQGREAFDGSAVAHLADVRDVMSGARWATGLLALVLAVWIGIGIGRRETRAIADSLRRAAVLTWSFIGLAALASLLDFSAVFTFFHSLFFASGTWQFPADALLILVFPEPFWAVAGGSWALLTAAFAGVYQALGVWLGHHSGGPAVQGRESEIASSA